MWVFFGNFFFESKGLFTYGGGPVPRVGGGPRLREVKEILRSHPVF